MNRSYPEGNSLDEIESAFDNIVARDALDDAMHGGGKIKASRPIPREQNLARRMGLIRSSKSERGNLMGNSVCLPRSLSHGRLGPLEPQGSLRMISTLGSNEPHFMIDPPQEKKKSYLPLYEPSVRIPHKSGRSKSADPERSQMLLRMTAETLPRQKLSKQNTGALVDSRALGLAAETTSPPSVRTNLAKEMTLRRNSSTKESSEGQYPLDPPQTLRVSKENLQSFDDDKIQISSRPMFQRRAMARSKSEGKHPRRRSRKRYTPQDYAKNTFIKIRVIGKVCDSPQATVRSKADTCVSLAFFNVMKTQKPAWGAMAAELSRVAPSAFIPKLSFTNPTNLDDAISFGDGTRRALLIGCYNTHLLYRMRDFLISNLHFDDISILDDPTKATVINAFRVMTHELRYGDSLLIYCTGKFAAGFSLHASNLCTGKVAHYS